MEKLAFKCRKLAFKCRQSANVSTCSLHLIVLSIFTHESFFSFKYLSSSGRSHVGSPFLSTVSRNGLTRYIIIWFLCHTFLPCSWHQGYRLLPRTHSHAFATFKHQFLTNMTRNQVKTCTVCLSFHSMPITMWSMKLLHPSFPFSKTCF